MRLKARFSKRKDWGRTVRAILLLRFPSVFFAMFYSVIPWHVLRASMPQYGKVA